MKISLARRSGARSSGTCCLDEPLEQAAEFSRPPEILRMPLHADAERRVRALDCFDHPVGRHGGGDEGGSDACDRLVQRREEWGVSYVVFGDDQVDQFAPVVARLAGT